MSAELLGLLFLLGGGLLSFLIFRPIAARFVSGQVDVGLSGRFMLHSLGGAAVLTASYFAGKALSIGGFLPLIAVALGWTLPALLLALRAGRRAREAARPRKET